MPGVRPQSPPEIAGFLCNATTFQGANAFGTIGIGGGPRVSAGPATYSVATWREPLEPLQAHLAPDFVRRDRHQDLS